jgi:hypothetical protein
LEESFVFNVKDSGKGKVDLVGYTVTMARRTANISSLTKTYPTNS